MPLNRFYAFKKLRYVEEVAGAVLFISWGILMVAGTLWMTLHETKNTSGEKWFWGLFALGCSLAYTFGVGSFLWRAIPLRVPIRSPEEFRQFFARRPYFLILWSFNRYSDFREASELEFDPESAGHIQFEGGMDEAIFSEADVNHATAVRLWREGSRLPLGSSPKSIHVLCPGDWMPIVKAAMSGALGIIVFNADSLRNREKGGLAKEVEHVVGSPSLLEKTLFLEDSLPQNERLRQIRSLIKERTKHLPCLWEKIWKRRFRRTGNDS